MAEERKELRRPAGKRGYELLRDVREYTEKMVGLGDVYPLAGEKLVQRAAGVLLALLEENDDLLEGYLKVAGEASSLEDKLDETKAKHKRAEHACARMGAKLNAQRGTLLEAVAAAAGRKEPHITL